MVLLGNDTEGTNRMETKDANGYQMVKEIIRVGQEQTEDTRIMYSRKKERQNLLRSVPTVRHLNRLDG